MIQSIATHLPTGQLSNAELAKTSEGWSEEKIFEKTGIRTRHVAGAAECSSDLAFYAAERLLQDENRSQIDFLLFCTQSPDYLLPTTACILQDRLKLPQSCGALDFNLGCSGYIYGIALAHGLLQSHLANNVLFLTADNYTRYIHPNDRGTRTIFGDGATATLLGADSPNRLSAFVFGTDGSGADRLIIKEGGARHSRPCAPSAPGSPSESRGENWLHMNGPEIFNFTLKSVPALARQVLDRASLKLDEIDWFVFHQANAFMLEHLRRKMGIPSGKFVLHLENCGNTVSSTIPIALEDMLRTGRIKAGHKILLAGFGVGFSWGGCILEWNA